MEKQARLANARSASPEFLSWFNCYFLPNSVWTSGLAARCVFTREMPNAAIKSPPTTDKEKAMLHLPWKSTPCWIEFHFESCTLGSNQVAAASTQLLRITRRKAAILPKASDDVSATSAAATLRPYSAIDRPVRSTSRFSISERRGGSTPPSDRSLRSALRLPPSPAPLPNPTPV